MIAPRRINNLFKWSQELSMNILPEKAPIQSYNVLEEVWYRYPMHPVPATVQF